jgi:hypothetical protein
VCRKQIFPPSHPSKRTRCRSEKFFGLHVRSPPVISQGFLRRLPEIRYEVVVISLPDRNDLGGEGLSEAQVSICRPKARLLIPTCMEGFAVA